MSFSKRPILCGLLIVSIFLSSLSFQVFSSASETSEDAVVFTGKFEHGDFEGTEEEVMVNWPWMWGCFDLTTEENHTPGGSQCLVIKPEGGAWQSMTYKDNTGESGIEIIPGATYRFSFWHKGAANGQLQVGDWGLDGNITGYKEVGAADSDWTYYYKDFVANARTRIAPIDLKNTVDGATAGAPSYFDDFQIEMISTPATPKPAKPLTEDETLAGKRENMEMGTNFWFHTYWSGCTPMKENINWEKAYANGDNIWNETFVEEIAPFTTLRFMDWNNTNGSTIVEWSERRLPTDPGNADIGMSGPGIAYEWMIDLCNRYDKNPWVCLPSSASDDYIREVAKIFKEKLEPGRKLYIEYSNEVWNYGFQQYGYCEEMGKKTTEIGLTEEIKFTDNYNANYYVYRSFQMFNIFEDVYGYEEMGKSCIRICATSGNMALFDAGYENVFYSKIYNPRDQRADYLAVAPYIGSGLDGNDMDITTLFHNAIDSSLDSYVKSAYNMGKKYGLPLVAYEGGQHLLLGADAWSRNPEIYNQYIYMLNQFAPYFELYCHYCLTGGWGSGGSWGANAYTGQPIEEAHKLRALYDWIEAPTNDYDSISFPEGAPSSASFQKGLDGWYTNAIDGSYEVVNNSQEAEDEGHPHYLAFRCTDNDNGGKYFESTFRLEPGETYTMKYDVICRVPGSTTDTRDFNFSILDYETNQHLGGKNWSSVRWGTMSIDSFTVPAGGTGLVKIRFSLSSWDPTGVCNMEGKVDNFRVYKLNGTAPSDPQEPTGTYVYQRQPLAAVTPLPRVTPTPTATAIPTSIATVKPSATPTVVPSTVPTSDTTDGPGLKPTVSNLPEKVEPTAIATAIPTTTPAVVPTIAPTTTTNVTATPTTSSTDNIEEETLKVKKIKFKKKKIKMNVGKKKVLKVTITPSAKKLNKAAKKVKWSINKKGKKVVMFVKKAKKFKGKFKAKIKAVKKGKAKVACKAPSGKKAVCKVTVK